MSVGYLLIGTEDNKIRLQGKHKPNFVEREWSVFIWDVATYGVSRIKAMWEV